TTPRVSPPRPAPFFSFSQRFNTSNKFLNLFPPPLRLGPIDPQETFHAGHLVVITDRHRVMDGGSFERVRPWWTCVVEICSRIASDILSAPPKVQVQLISLRRTGRITRCTEHGTALSCR